MNNLVSYDPFVDTGMDELFRGFFKPVRMEGARTPVTIKMDVTETKDGYMVHAEMPGVKKENINVEIEGNEVTITAEVKREWEKKEGDKVLRSERYFGNVYRSFTLPARARRGEERRQVRRRRARVEARQEGGRRGQEAAGDVTLQPAVAGPRLGSSAGMPGKEGPPRGGPSAFSEHAVLGEDVRELRAGGQFVARVVLPGDLRERPSQRLVFDGLRHDDDAVGIAHDEVARRRRRPRRSGWACRSRRPCRGLSSRAARCRRERPESAAPEWRGYRGPCRRSRNRPRRVPAMRSRAARPRARCGASRSNRRRRLRRA